MEVSMKKERVEPCYGGDIFVFSKEGLLWKAF